MPIETRWKATYSDGTTLDQYASDGSEAFFRDIDQSKLAYFGIYVGDRLVLGVDFQSALFSLRDRAIQFEDFAKGPYRLIFYRRTQHVFIVGTTLPKSTKVFPTLGLQTTQDGKNHKHIVSLMEDGSFRIDWW